jgi:hypothetical protein
MAALYAQAVADGMRTTTLAAATPLARAFSGAPRAIAFPFIPGGTLPTFEGTPLNPATIDYHDNVAGMTFEAGAALPTRVFPYALDPTSHYNVPLAQLQAAAYPQLTAVAAASGQLIFHFQSAAAQHFGVALWGDPTALGLSGANVVPAGHGGAVAVFDLPAGASDQIVHCTQCTATTLPYST